MAGLSVVIITFNERDNIREALESARFADEIVVVDSFSTDGTLEICREYTDKVYQEKWRGFSGQKDYAVSLASNDWVFVLDSDERFTEELANEVRAILEGGPDRNGYRCPRRNHFMGREIKYGGWYPDYSVRLFDRRKSRFAKRAVHEAVDVDGGAGSLLNPMLHYTYKGISDYLVRMDKYSGLAAEELYYKGRRAGITSLLFRPPFTFVKMYLVKLGFLDGIHGLALAMLYSFYTFAKYAKLWEMQSGKDGGRA